MLDIKLKNKKFVKYSSSNVLIVGLGNYGSRYENTLHNIGFIILDYLVKKFDLKIDYKNRFLGEVAKLKQLNKKIIFLKPYTFMNNSGKSVKIVSRYFKIRTKNIIVLYDDFDLLWGKIRIRFSGSSSGHKGIESIITYLKSENFWRIRYGIKKNKISNLEKYVLSNIPKDKIKFLDFYKDLTFNIINEFLKTNSLENKTFNFIE